MCLASTPRTTCAAECRWLQSPNLDTAESRLWSVDPIPRSIMPKPHHSGKVPRRTSAALSHVLGHATALVCLLAQGLCAFNALASYRSDPDYLIDTWETQQGLPDE